MKAIKITQENDQSIAAAVNGKAHAFAEVMAVAEAKLLGLVAKKDAAGAVFVSHSGGTVPNAYDYKRQGTLERRSSAWYLADVKQFDLWKSPPADVLALTNDQNAAATARFKKQYQVIA